MANPSVKYSGILSLNKESQTVGNVMREGEREREGDAIFRKGFLKEICDHKWQWWFKGGTNRWPLLWLFSTLSFRYSCS